MSDVGQHDVHDSGQHAGIPVVEVDLVPREGGPQRALAVPPRERRDQRMRPGPEDALELSVPTNLDEEVPSPRVVIEESAHPGMRGGDVVQDQVQHHLEVPGDRGDVAPIPQLRVNGRVVLHGETVIRGGGKDREQVHRGDQPLQPLPKELVERPQRRLAGSADLIGVGDQDGVALGPRPTTRRRRIPLGRVCAEDRDDLPEGLVAPVPVQLIELPPEATKRLGGQLGERCGRVQSINDCRSGSPNRVPGSRVHATRCRPAPHGAQVGTAVRRAGPR